MTDVVVTVVEILLADSGVAGIFADRVYPANAPDAPEYPHAVVTKVTGFGSYTNDGDAGIEDARVQVDVYADGGYEAFTEAKTAVRRCLTARKGGTASGDPCAIDACFCINDIDFAVGSTERPGPRARRRLLEFRIWNREV